MSSRKEVKEKMISRIEELEKEIAELKKQVNEEENRKGRWIPKDGEDYWTISGGVVVRYYVQQEQDFDKNIINSCKVFKTREEAEFELKRQKVLRKMEEFEYRFTDEEMADKDIPKWRIYYYRAYKSVEIDFVTNTCQPLIYFKTLYDAQDCIDAVGAENLKKYYFCVE